MSRIVYLVGLGNHGSAYRYTRHNVGVLALELLADRLGLPWARRQGYDECVCPRDRFEALVTAPDVAGLMPKRPPPSKKRRAKGQQQTDDADPSVPARLPTPAPTPEPPVDLVTELRLIRLRTYMNVSGEKFRSLLRAESIPASTFTAASPIPPFLFLQDDLDKPLGTLSFKLTGSAAGHNGVRSVQALVRSDALARLKLGIGRPPEKDMVADYVLEPFAARELEAVREGVALASWGMVGEWVCKWERGEMVGVPGTVKVDVGEG